MCAGDAAQGEILEPDTRMKQLRLMAAHYDEIVSPCREHLGASRCSIDGTKTLAACLQQVGDVGQRRPDEDAAVLLRDRQGGRAAHQQVLSVMNGSQQPDCNGSGSEIAASMTPR